MGKFFACRRFRLKSVFFEIKLLSENFFNFQRNKVVNQIRLGNVTHQKRIEYIEGNKFIAFQNPLNVRFISPVVLPKIFSADVDCVRIICGIKFIKTHALRQSCQRDRPLKSMSNGTVILPAFFGKIFNRQVGLQKFFQSTCTRPKHCTGRKVKIIRLARGNPYSIQQIINRLPVGQPSKRRIRNIFGRSGINQTDFFVFVKSPENFFDSSRISQKSVKKIMSPFFLFGAGVKRFF